MPNDVYDHFYRADIEVPVYVREIVGRLMVVFVLPHEEVEKRNVGDVEESIVAPEREVLSSWQVGPIDTEHKVDAWMC